ncbi:response regulator [Pararhizobium gei]|uniref:response regulator n=1 Tax=Pararhizobium gei TaxID=1395951 RepID=UPI0023DA0067|nr:response regulator transcription factor [Rhizobium gei]
MTKNLTIAIVDDHPLFREGVMRILSEVDGFEVVGQGSSRDDAIRLCADLQPDILLMDISMPGGGLNAISPILDVAPAQKIVMLTVSEASDDVLAALNKGAKAYVLKGVGSETLAEIVRTVGAGETYVSPSLSARLLSSLATRQTDAANRNPLADLTAREHGVLQLVAAGLSNKRIALKLDVHEKTVKHHLTSIFVKLGATNRTEAAMIFMNMSLNRPQVATAWSHLPE